MHAGEYNFQRLQIESEIMRCQNVIKAVNESQEMPEDRKAAYLDYHRPRVTQLYGELETLNKSYWGHYYGYSACGATIGAN